VIVSWVWCNIVAPTAEYSRESLPEELSEHHLWRVHSEFRRRYNVFLERMVSMVGTREKRAQTPYTACETGSNARDSWWEIRYNGARRCWYLPLQLALLAVSWVNMLADSRSLPGATREKYSFDDSLARISRASFETLRTGFSSVSEMRVTSYASRGWGIGARVKATGVQVKRGVDDCSSDRENGIRG